MTGSLSNPVHVFHYLWVYFRDAGNYQLQATEITAYFQQISIITKNRNGGERGIRTPETVSRLHAFQACAFSHSATSPKVPFHKEQDLGV